MSQQICCDALHHGSAISIIQATVGDSDSHEEKETEVPKAAPKAVVAEGANKRKSTRFQRVNSDWYPDLHHLFRGKLNLDITSWEGSNKIVAAY